MNLGHIVNKLNSRVSGLVKVLAVHFFVRIFWSFENFSPRVNFINILQAAFAQIFLRQKITKPNCKHKKFSAQEYWRKSCS